MVGGADRAAFDMQLLRSQVIVLNRPTIGEMTIREYLGMASPEVSSSAMLDALTCVGLRARLASLPQGLDTRLATSGAPLAINEVMALKLANALLVRPRVLMLAQLYDLLPTARLVQVLRQLKDAGTTTLLCTGRPEDITLDGWMYIAPTRQERLTTRAALVAATQQQESGHAERG
jgi:putative ABC transport system ATP-binding protein